MNLEAPDLNMEYETLAEVQATFQFNFGAPGWYYRNEGQSCLLLTNEDNKWQVMLWNAFDPRPLLKRLLEMQVHYV